MILDVYFPEYFHVVFSPFSFQYIRIFQAFSFPFPLRHIPKQTGWLP